MFHQQVSNAVLLTIFVLALMKSASLCIYARSEAASLVWALFTAALAVASILAVFGMIHLKLKA